MPKTKISEFDTNPDNNTDINSINIAEGCPPSSINNAIRQLMADLKEFQTGGGGDPFNGAVNGTVGATTPNTGAFTTLSASSTVSGTGFSNYLASPPAIGSSAANTGAFTTLSASGAASFNGGVTLGDASGDALTINSSAVSIPNGLNFDGNTFVIDATNNRVGVGTASPATTVDITGSLQASGVSYLNNDLYVGSAGAQEFSVLKDGTNAFLNARLTGGSLIFRTNGSTERMRITSAGNVGIGTTSPNARLSVRNTGAQVDISSSATNVTFESIDRSATTNPVDTLYYTRNGTFQWYNSSYAERMRLDASGNLGLGVTPSAWTSSWRALQTSGLSLASPNTSSLYLGQNWFQGSGGNTYINTAAASFYAQISGSHSWHIAPSGTAGNAITFTQAMTLDASGNLAIGTTSPTGKLTVRPNSAYLDVTSGRLDSTNNVRIAAAGTSSTYLEYRGFLGHIWDVDTTERMRIDSSGNLLVGTTSAGGGTNTKGVTVNQVGQVAVERDGGIALVLNRFTSDGSIAIFRRSATQVGSIDVTTTATSYVTSSDYRLKENISPMIGALAKVAQLKPVTYNWKVDGSSGQGFIAHELQEVVPDCVTGEKDAVDADGNPVYQGIDTSFLVATLTAAIQELKAEVDSLKAQLNK